MVIVRCRRRRRGHTSSQTDSLLSGTGRIALVAEQGWVCKQQLLACRPFRGVAVKAPRNEAVRSLRGQIFALDHWSVRLVAAKAMEVLVDRNRVGQRER